MISFEEALACVLEHAHKLESERREVAKASGLALTEDIQARIDNPRFDNSAMDGYAVCSADLSGASEDKPVRLEIIEEIPAGVVGAREVRAGQAIRIMTGAPLPKGADAVVMVEQTDSSGNDVLIFHAPKVGENIRCRGEDVRAGDILIEQGQTIRPQEVLALATQGIANVNVHRSPRIAIIATGDELTAPAEELKPGHIYEGSSSMLAAQIGLCGAHPVPLGIVQDDIQSIEEKIREGMKADCILMTGGVSVGDYDFNRRVLQKMGMKEIFWRVAIKPGKPVLFGTLDGRLIFGLPGNPIATFVVFEVLVRPVLKKMMGCTPPFERCMLAKLASLVKRDAKRDQFLMAKIDFEDGEPRIVTSSPQGSAHLKPSLGANCLVRIHRGDGSLSAGDKVWVWPLEE